MTPDECMMSSVASMAVGFTEDTTPEVRNGTLQAVCTERISGTQHQQVIAWMRGVGACGLRHTGDMHGSG